MKLKDIDKMTDNELRAEVRVLRAVYEAAKEITESIQCQSETTPGGIQFEFFTPELDRHWVIRAKKAIAVVEALHKKGK